MKSSTLFECGPLPSSSLVPRPLPDFISQLWRKLAKEQGYPTSCPPDVIHVISVSRPSLFFAALPLTCAIVNVSKKKAKNGGQVAGFVAMVMY